ERWHEAAGRLPELEHLQHPRAGAQADVGKRRLRAAAAEECDRDEPDAGDPRRRLTDRGTVVGGDRPRLLVPLAEPFAAAAEDPVRLPRHPERERAGVVPADREAGAPVPRE